MQVLEQAGQIPHWRGEEEEEATRRIKVSWNLIWIVVFVVHVHTAHVGMSSHCFALSLMQTFGCFKVARLIVALVTVDSGQGFPFRL